MNPIVDPEFKALIPLLNMDEQQQLEANLLDGMVSVFTSPVK